MNGESSMLLLGIGTAGASIARGVSRAFGNGLRYALIDTDATTGDGDGPFTLLGGDRLSGRGTGGDIVAARLAAEDSIEVIDEHLEGIRLVVIATALGGGTGGGATLETVKHLAQRGIPSIVFATTPFAFEGDDRQRNARGVMSMIEERANATFFLPLDKLVSGEDKMDDALRRAIDTVAIGITMFWRLVEKPGYLRIDIDRIRRIVSSAGRGRFAAVTVQGPERAIAALDQIKSAETLSGSTPVHSIVCGILAGEDLRLSEIGHIANGIRKTFGEKLAFDLGTVNDEATFCGRICVIVMLFDASGKEDSQSDGSAPSGKRHYKPRGSLQPGPIGRGRFNNAEQTLWNGEDLDIPTFVRREINLEF